MIICNWYSALFTFLIVKVYIQRTKGCDHIVCVRCKTEFCYKCGDRFRDIKFIGWSSWNRFFLLVEHKHQQCLCFLNLGDHYSELSVLGCKYRFHPDNPWKRRLIRGSILGGKILAAPIVLCLAVVAGTVCAGIGLPAYCCFLVAREIKVWYHEWILRAFSRVMLNVPFLTGEKKKTTSREIERICSNEL